MAPIDFRPRPRHRGVDVALRVGHSSVAAIGHREDSDGRRQEPKPRTPGQTKEPHGNKPTTLMGEDHYI